MTLEFPKANRGGRLSHKHVNALSKIAKESRLLKNDGYGINTAGQSVSQSPFNQRRIIIVTEDFALGQAGGVQGVYEFRFLYWNKGADVDEGSSASSSSKSSVSSLDVASFASQWETDDTGYTQFLDGTDLPEALEDGAKLVAFFDNQRGMWVPISAPPAAATVEPVEAETCCGTAVACSQMTVAGFYAQKYTFKDIPAKFGGVGAQGRVVVEYVGLRSGTGYFYWESDDFRIECDDGVDTYFWRMEVLANGNSTTCKAEGSENCRIYLVRAAIAGVAALCGDMTAVNCASACTGRIEGGDGEVSSSSNSSSS